MNLIQGNEGLLEVPRQGGGELPVAYGHEELVLELRQLVRHHLKCPVVVSLQLPLVNELQRNK